MWDEANKLKHLILGPCFKTGLEDNEHMLKHLHVRCDGVKKVEVLDSIGKYRLIAR